MTTEKDRECELRMSIQTKVARILMLVKLTNIAACSFSLVPGIAGALIGTNGIVAEGIDVTVMRFIGTFVEIWENAKNTKWLELKGKSRSKMTVIGESVSPYEQLKGTWCGV